MQRVKTQYFRNQIHEMAFSHLSPILKNMVSVFWSVICGCFILKIRSLSVLILGPYIIYNPPPPFVLFVTFSYRI